MSLKWWSLTGVRESPFSYSNLGWKKWKSGKVTWFSRQPPVHWRWWAKKGKWKEEGGVVGRCDREGIVWCASQTVLMALVCCWLRQDVWPAVLISQRWSFFFLPPTSLFSLWGEVSPHSGSQAVASGTTSCLCHQLSPALSLLPHWLNTWRTFEWQAPFCPSTSPLKPGPSEESSIFIPSPTSCLPLCVLSHSYVKAEIKHMVLICNKSTVTQADFLHWIFIVRVTRRPAPVCVWSLALFITKVCWQTVSTKAQQAYNLHSSYKVT